MNDQIEKYLKLLHGENIKISVVGNLVYVYTDNKTEIYELNYLQYLIDTKQI